MEIQGYQSIHQRHQDGCKQPIGSNQSFVGEIYVLCRAYHSTITQFNPLEFPTGQQPHDSSSGGSWSLAARRLHTVSGGSLMGRASLALINQQPAPSLTGSDPLLHLTGPTGPPTWVRLGFHWSQCWVQMCPPNLIAPRCPLAVPLQVL